MLWILIITIGIIILGTAIWKLHPLPVLIFGAFFFGVCNSMPMTKVLATISTGFGKTLTGIGLVIIAGTIIGVFMEKRGALTAVAEKVIAVTGKKRSALAMTIIGFIVSIAIFCDSAFVILIGLWRKLSIISKISFASGAAALSMGLFATHCFIPPTPGPLVAVDQLSADIGLVALFGTAAAIVASTAGYFYAMFFGKNVEVAAPPEEKASLEEAEVTEYKRHWSIALLPILLPLILIAGGSIVKFMKKSTSEQPEAVSAIESAFEVLGTPLVALVIGAVIAIFCLGKWKKSELGTNGILGNAVLQAANILVITGAGGAFGEILREAKLETILPDSFGSLGVWAIFVPLIIAALLKTAHGSSTVAIITAAGIIAPLIDVLGFTTPALRALACSAICCGSMMVSHTNDSYFWVVTQFSGMNVRQGLRLQTGASFVSGLAAACLIFVLAIFLK